MIVLIELSSDSETLNILNKPEIFLGSGCQIILDFYIGFPPCLEITKFGLPKIAQQYLLVMITWTGVLPRNKLELSTCLYCPNRVVLTDSHASQPGSQSTKLFFVSQILLEPRTRHRILE